jgi:GrpB-like predicted nucleotidyltransferase (UPF0157 family)
VRCPTRRVAGGRTPRSLRSLGCSPLNAKVVRPQDSTVIDIVDYCPNWNLEFQKVAGLVRAGLGNTALRIDHIGSTSVPHLCAKDVIDLQITVAKLDASVAGRLSELGFVQHPEINGDHIPPGYGGPRSDWEKFFFVRPNGQRRTNIHVRQSGRPNQRYALLFRDYLVAHPLAAVAYGELKRRLAALVDSEDAYADVKDPAVDLIYLAAEAWALRSRWQP